ncbi:carbohydrate-binding family 9-like protein [Chitinophaga sp. Cy-1792]|uniref:carbohydrate-binding family 9-like protein n=1 Tax=Chitinophaga sp. Cy-1792 TaxID=2608339 RepID=UPI0014248081|nr:carbohydrate-binding family 9-like protein [Chitinophaga sp. Cy-1792]NIG52579.1 carbohydrate-binding family 9-like protein [Chitinophaga sp. Cy-1792]
MLERLCLLVTLAMGVGFAVPADGQVASRNFKNYTIVPENYVCYKTAGNIKIDGDLNESSWQNVPWTKDFVDIEGTTKPTPRYRTRIKMLWDKNYLYIGAWLQEPHIWATLTQRDAVIYHDNDFEVFIDPNGDTHQYFELEINAFNTLMDLFMSKPYRNGGSFDMKWDTKGVKTAVKINGTINHPADQDSSWTVEMAIPFSALQLTDKSAVPADNDIWRINFSRVEWDTDIVDGKYVKLKKPENNWVWSAQEMIDMHAPERWGYLQFAAASAGKGNKTFVYPADTEARKEAWRLYNLQREYRASHGKYASSLTELNITDKINVDNGGTYNITLSGDGSSFEWTIKGKKIAADILHINQDGKIWLQKK